MGQLESLIKLDIAQSSHTKKKKSFYTLLYYFNNNSIFFIIYIIKILNSYTFNSKSRDNLLVQGFDNGARCHTGKLCGIGDSTITFAGGVLASRIYYCEAVSSGGHAIAEDHFQWGIEYSFWN